MVMRAVICKGDPTSHGGKVLEGNEFVTTNGRQIAQKGHMTYCPQCKGNFPIEEGLDFHTIAGVGTAVEGMKASCGAILIATTTKDSMVIDDRSEADAGAAAETATSAAATMPPNFGSFRAIDESTGKPVPGMPYRIDLPDGTTLRGVTDADGYTERVTGHDPATVKLRWENDQLIEGA